MKTITILLFLAILSQSSIAQCDPPLSFTVTSQGNSSFEFHLEPPDSTSFLGFNVYFEGSFLFTIGSGYYYWANPLPPGIYEFCASTVCNNGESDLICDTTFVSQNVLPVPQNITGEYISPYVHLSWNSTNGEKKRVPMTLMNSSGTKTLLGYNIYHALNYSNFDSLDFTIETSYIHPVEAGSGLHQYFVTALYDIGESLPSDTIDVLVSGLPGYTRVTTTIIPNPVEDVLYINSGEQIKEVVIHNNHGREVLRKSLNSRKFQIHVGELTNGIYLISLTSEKDVIKKKIIVK